jgi:hypothetical protein
MIQGGKGLGDSGIGSEVRSAASRIRCECCSIAVGSQGRRQTRGGALHKAERGVLLRLEGTSRPRHSSFKMRLPSFSALP